MKTFVLVTRWVASVIRLSPHQLKGIALRLLANAVGPPDPVRASGGDEDETARNARRALLRPHGIASYFTRPELAYRTITRATFAMQEATARSLHATAVEKSEGRSARASRR